MDTDTREYARGDLRVSDADRDRALADLSEHYQAGRLTLEEFDDRSGQALRAKTARDLTGLFTDLPATQAPAGTGGAVAVPEARSHVLASRVVVAAVALSAVAIVLALAARTGVGHHRGFVFPVPIFVLFFIVRSLIWRRSRRGRAVPDDPAQDR